MTEFTKEYIRSVRMCSYLIEPPASEVIEHLCDEIERLQAENEKLKSKATTCESALLSMVYQYLYRPLDPRTNEPANNLYQHDFMSAGEEACHYLVTNGLAEWVDDDSWAIRMKESEGE